MTKQADSCIALRAYPEEVHDHAHDHHQMVLPLTGALEMEIDGRGGLVDDLRGAFVPAGRRHAFIGRPAADGSARPARCVVLDVAQTGHAPLDAAAERSAPFFTLDRAMQHLLGFVAARGAADAAVKTLLLATAVDGLTPGDRRPQEPRQLRRALGFMEARAHQPITVREIAEAAAVSESRLYALFRNWMDRSPQAHLTDIRLRRAREALLDGEASIAEIALSAGFSDQTAFTRAFKRVTGTTPAAYRRGSA